MKILFVCLGNICRSPIADGIMRRLVTERALDWEVDSAGTGGWHVGAPPDARAVRTARKYGTDLSPLRARQFSRKDFAQYDKIYALDLQNLQDILKLAKTQEERDKVELFLEAAFPGKREGVRDPWYDDDLFEPVYHEIQDACERILERITQESVR